MTADQLPAGFESAGVYCGVKDNKQKFDLSLFVSDRPCSAAGVFTQNRVCGAPVVISRERVPSSSARAVIINSGNANACTGERGLEDARWMTELTAQLIGCAVKDVLICSTGVIGHFLPRNALESGIPAAAEALGSSSESFLNAAKGMMTTDTFPKMATREFETRGKTIRISGAAKGAAMIAPDMATMLAVIMTDATIFSDEAQRLLNAAVDRSFNCISVEGHTSTSDTVLLLANGAADIDDLQPDELDKFAIKLDEVCQELAQTIIQDAEGAEHLIIIDAEGLKDPEDARRIARMVADSPLVKTAITGADPNWGRIVSAVGYAGVDLEETDITLSINGTKIYEQGMPVEYDEAALSQKMRDNRNVRIRLTFPLGEHSLRFWTSDLTAEYIRLNSEYTT